MSSNDPSSSSGISVKPSKNGTWHHPSHASGPQQLHVRTPTWHRSDTNRRMGLVPSGPELNLPETSTRYYRCANIPQLLQSKEHHVLHCVR